MHCAVSFLKFVIQRMASTRVTRSTTKAQKQQPSITHTTTPETIRAFTSSAASTSSRAPLIKQGKENYSSTKREEIYGQGFGAVNTLHSVPQRIDQHHGHYHSAGIYVGTSGYTYPNWRPAFYPSDLPKARELFYMTRQFNSLEINGTFYCLQIPTTFQKWYEVSPPNFIYSVKGPRFITHLKRLKDIRIPLANFFASGVLELKEKLGPILWQLPPNVEFNYERMEEFLRLLPSNTFDAAELAKEYDAVKLKGKALCTTSEQRRLRYAIEVRHKSYCDPMFFNLLKQYNIACVVSDSAQKFPVFVEITSDLLYIRLHGASDLYSSNYTTPELENWATKIHKWRIIRPESESCSDDIVKVRDTYVYFDNDSKVHAPFNAAELYNLLAPKMEP